MAPDSYILKSNTIPILDLYMVITMKKTVLFLMVIFLMIGVCGCDMKGQDKVDMMVSYINDKYSDDSFEYVSMSGGHLGSNTTKIIVRSAKYPDKEIRVICSGSDGDFAYSDTYLNIKFEEETRAYIEKALYSAFNGVAYVQYIPDDTGSMKNGTSETQFKDFISDSSTFVYFNAVVILDEIDENDALESIKNAFANGVVRGDIYFVNSEHADKIDGNPMSLIENNQYYKVLYFIKNGVDKYKSIEWKDCV